MKSGLPLAFAVALSAGILASPLRAEPALTLHIMSPARPGQLTECPQQATAGAAAAWTRVTARATLVWSGGGVTLNPQAGPATSDARLAEHCFRLDLDGQPLVFGAIVSRHSARRLAFPVLLEAARTSPPAELTLSPSLPSTAASGTPPPWLQRLQARFPRTDAPR